jgi:single-stranded DNA-binding protein
MRGTAEFMIVGRIGKLTKLGKTLKLNIASDYPYKDDNGEWKDNTHWNTVTVFSAATVTWAEKNLAAGDLVQTRGRLKNGSYEKDGATVYTTDLIATDLTKLANAPAKKKPSAAKKKQAA